MASLVPWLGVGQKKRDDNLLNSLSNFDVRTNNAATRQYQTTANAPVGNNAGAAAARAPMGNSQANTLQALNDLDVRSNNSTVNPVKTLSQFDSTLSKLHKQNGGELDSNGKMSFDDFKATMSAKSAIENGGAGAPFKPNIIKNAESIIKANKDFDERNQNQQINKNDFTRGLKEFTANAERNYDSENKLRLDRPAITSLRDIEDNGDAYNDRHKANQSLAAASFRSVLGDNAKNDDYTRNVSYRNLLDSYNNASGDQQADVKKNIADTIVTLREKAKQSSGNEQGELLKSVNYLSDLNSLINQYGEDKGKSLGRQIGDWFSTGGILGDVGGDAVEQLLGNVTGTSGKIKADIEKRQNARQDLGAVGVANTALGAVGNFASNVVTGGAAGAANAGVGALNTMMGMNDQVLDYDENGNSYLRKKNQSEMAGELGNTALNVAFAAAGAKGIGPALGTSGVNTATGLAKLSAKDLAKYAAQELPWAAGTTYLQEGLGNLAQNKDWNDMDAGSFAKNLVGNLAQDVGMDVANYNAGKASQRNNTPTNDTNLTQRLKVANDDATVRQNEVIPERQPEATVRPEVESNRVRYNDEGTAVKVNEDGTTNRLSNSELAKVANTDIGNTRINQDTYSRAVEPDYVVRSDNESSLRTLRDNEISNRSINKSELARLIERTNAGDPEATRILEEYGYKPSNEDEQTDWRTKTVDEMINPEKTQAAKQKEAIEAMRGTDIDVNPLKTKEGLAETNTQRMQELNDKLLKQENTDIASLIADEDFALYNYLEGQGAINDDGVDFTKLTDAQRQRIVNLIMDADPEAKLVDENTVNPNQLGLLDQVQIKDMESNNQPIQRNELAEVGEMVVPKERTQDTTMDTRVNNSGAEGSVESSTRVPRENETSTLRVDNQGSITSEDATSLLGRVNNAVDNIYTSLVNRGAVVRLTRALETASTGEKVDKNITFARITKEMLNDINVIRELQGKTPLTDRNITAFSGAINEHLGEHIKNYGSARNVAQAAFDVLTSSDTLVLPGNASSNYKGTLLVKKNPNRFADSVSLGDTESGKTSLKNISPRSTKEIKNASARRNELLGDGLVGGSTTLHTIPTESAAGLPNSARQAIDISNISQKSEKVNPTPESGFAKNTSLNDNFSAETRKALKDNPISYEPATNEERLARANEILSTKSADEVDSYLRDNFINAKDKDRNSADMVLAGEFAKMLDAQGQYDRSTELINKMSEIGTKQGQNIQALSLMMNRSPEGIANMAQSAIKKGGGEMTGELRRQIVENTQAIGQTRGQRAELARVNDEISKQIMNGEGDLKALRKEQMAIAQRYRQNLDLESRQFSNLSDIVNKNSPDNRSVFGSVWRAGLLSGPRTHTGNAVSNIFQNVLNAGADRIASGLDWARSAITGKEREVVSSAGGRAKGLGRGLKSAGEVLKSGTNLWEGSDIVTGRTTAWGQGGELEFKNKLANAMVAKPTNFVFRAMSAGDLPFRYSAWENAVRTEAKRQGINQGYRGQALQDYINSRVATPDPELQAYGIRKGNESVYDVDTKLSGIMNRVDKFIDSQENKAVKAGLRTAKTLIAPFVKVPSKVLSTAIDYSPLGAVKAMVNKVGSKGYTTGQFETDLAKSGLGTVGFVGLGYALSEAGLLTGGYPEDQNERNRWKAEGIEPNSIKIGDTYLSLNYLGPASMLMAMGSGVQQRQAKGEDPLSVATGTVMDTLNTFLDQSYVQGLSNALQAVTDSQRYGESYVNSFARGLVPNLLRQTASATDPMQRQTNDIQDAIVSGIPGLSQSLETKKDTYGRDIENKQALPLGQMWDALKLSNARETTNVIDEVSRLHAVDPGNKDLQVTPPAQGKTISDDGENIKLTETQRSQLQKDVGEAATFAMNQVMKSKEYAGLTDEQKAEALNNACKAAQKKARDQFKKANGITAEENPGTANSGGSVDKNFANKAISNAKTDKEDGVITINDSIADEYKNILNKYNSMEKEDWDKYINGDSLESANAEYNLARAKYENDLADGKVSATEKVKREKELAKMEATKDYTKEVRDAYSLASNKADIQKYLSGITDEEKKAKIIGALNGLNNTLYNMGLISKSSYNSHGRNINNLDKAKSSRSKKSGSSSNGLSDKEAAALKALTKAKASFDTSSFKVKVPDAPNTKRQMQSSKMNSYTLKEYAPKKATIQVKKGANNKKGK